MNNKLCWTPIAESFLESGTNGILLISPFIQKQALKSIVSRFQNTDTLQVITRWNAGDIVAGVSDLEVYPYLSELGVPLYINSKIHLKLTVFENDIAFHSSGNITERGLGLSKNSNIEIGCKVILADEDWLKLYELLEQSIRVDDFIYAQAKEYLNANKDKNPPLPKLKYETTGIPKAFSRHSLPFIKNPELLWKYYSIDHFEGSRANYVHDLDLYDIFERGLMRGEFFAKLEVNFKAHPFIQEIAKFIRQEANLRFGAVNSWLTAKCSDRPVPFRWEMKPATNRLYNWLEVFYDEISWDVPGSHSQVIRWNA